MPNLPPDQDPSQDHGDDDELELEPVDPEILAHQRRRANERSEKAFGQAAVDDLLRDEETAELTLDTGDWRQFRFGTRHLLIATGVLALMMTIGRSQNACMILFVLGVITVGAGWIWVTVLERRRSAELARRREELLTGVARDQRAAARGPDAGGTTAERPVTQPGWRFDFRFSIRELLISISVASVLLAVLRWVSKETLTLSLGILALLGLVVSALGFEPPRAVVLGWWVLLVLYLLFGFISAVTAAA
jgi:hypothetical protein